MKKNILTSVVASTVLASVLVMSGCGGSNSPVDNENNSGSFHKDSGDKEAVGSAKIEAGADGKVNTTVELVTDKTKRTIATATVTQVLKDGEPACGTGEECRVLAKQVSACQIDASAPSFEKALTHIDDLIYGAGDRFDASEHMIVFGGTMQISATGFDQAALDLDIDMISCGSAITKDRKSIPQTGFSNEGHVVDVFVETAADPLSTKSIDEKKKGFWIRDVRIKDGKIQLTTAKIEAEFKKVGGEGKCLDMPVTFTFYSIKKSDKPNTTGMSGSTGAGGY